MNHSRTQPGFSLIELLASITIIAVLIALAIPALAHAKRSARFASALSNQRQVMQIIGAYTQDNRDTHPYLVSGQIANLEPRLDEPVGSANGLAPAIQSRFWINTLLEEKPELLEIVYPNLGYWPELRTMHEERGVYESALQATSTLFAAPAYFSDAQPVNDQQLRATRSTEIRYPAAKMILYDWSSAFLNSTRDMQYGPGLREGYAFADGSAAAILYSDFSQGPHVERVFCRDGAGFSTTDGLAGRDR